MTVRNDLLTIIFRRTGRIGSFTVTAGKLMILLVLVVVVNVVLLFSLFQYLTLRHKNVVLTERMSSVEAERAQMREEITEARYYKKWADAIIYRRLYNGSLSGQGSSSSLNSSFHDSLKLEPETAIVNNSLLGIDDFQVRSLNLESDLELSFNVINKDKNNRVVSGYLIVVGMNEEVIPPLYGVFPCIECTNGVPLDYQEGMSFALRYLRPVKARINQPSIGSKFNKVVVMVYSSQGEPILKQGFNLEKLLQPGYGS
jgi:uncharacterized membrane protein